MISCQNERSLDFYYVSFGKYNDYEGSDTLLIKQDIKISKDLYEISYNLRKDTDSVVRKYSLSINTPVKCRFTINNNVSEDFHFYMDTIIQIDKGQRLKISEYILNEGIIDGASLHYWTPEYGIFLIRSTTWPSVTIMQTNDSTLNRQLLSLVESSLSKKERKFFLRGRLMEMINDK